MFQATTAVKKIHRLRARKKVVQGGTSAGKTIAILAILIDRAARVAGLEISVVSESVPHLRRGAIKDFIKLMKDTGRWIPDHFNKGLLTYTFGNGSTIEFFSADQEGRLRGARRHILYLNEANNIGFEEYDQMAIRTSGDIYIDFNPTHKFWAHTEVLTEPDAELLILTYLDNEGIPKNTLADLMIRKKKGETSNYWHNWWQVYGLGQIGSLEGVVFDNWEKIDDIPRDAEFLGCGMDFGYTNDPTCLLAVYNFNHRFYYDQLIYQTGLKNPQIAKMILQMGITEIVYADSAEPKSIDEIADYGIQIVGAPKGGDSVRDGIQLMQQEPFYITSRSVETINDFQNYVWLKDAHGKSTNTPTKAFKHAPDAARYWHLGNKHGEPESTEFSLY